MGDEDSYLWVGMEQITWDSVGTVDKTDFTESEQGEARGGVLCQRSAVLWLF